VALLRRALGLLVRLPDTRDRAELELALQLTLGAPLIATRGYAAPDVGRLYARARQLCDRLGETPEFLQVLWGLWVFQILRSELGTSRETAEEFLRRAERLGDPAFVVRGHLAIEVTSLAIGEFVLTIEHFDKALSLYDARRHRDDAFRYAQNPGVASQCHA